MFQQEILDKIKKYDVITIFRHISPDGDAYGSQNGLKALIQENFKDKQVFVLGEKSIHFDKFLKTMDENVSDEIIKDSLAIVLDVANIARVDDQRFLLAKDIIKIDHHIYVEPFKQSEDYVEWVQNDYIATCEMIADFAYQNNLVVNNEAATSLYLGIITDSGRFLYPNTSRRTLTLAGKLLDDGSVMSEIYNFIYEQEENQVKFKGYCQQNFNKTPNGVAYNIITLDLMKQFGIDANGGAGVVNVLSGIKNIPIWVHFAYKEDGTIKVEFRSKKIPVNEVATKYGGGGHKNASGAVINDEHLISFILLDLDNLVKEYNENV